MKRLGFSAVTFFATCFMLPSAVAAGGANDRLCGAADDRLVVTIYGTSGDDHLEGSEGDDVIWGGLGDDTIIASGGSDQICAGGGADRIDGGQGFDRYFPGRGDDLVTDPEGGLTMSRGAGDDTLVALQAGPDNFVIVNDVKGDNVILTGESTDILQLGPGDDVVRTGGNIDDIRSGGGQDALRGGGGPDTFFLLGQGARVWAGSGGDDTAVYFDAQRGLRADLRSGVVALKGRSRGDRIRGIDRLLGGEHNDTLIGSTSADSLEGGGGNDRLRGGPEADLLFGNDGDDYINGGLPGAELELDPDVVYGGAGFDTCLNGQVNECE